MINYIYDLDQDEQAELDLLESGQLKEVDDIAAFTKHLKAAAEATLNKNKTISVRLSARDIEKIKRKAAHEGLPYQTYIASTLHKAAA